MDISKLYTDIWQLIGSYLPSDDLYSFSLTCKQSWKACKRPVLMAKMSYPMLYPWRLTYEQRFLVKDMEKGNTKFKLINGDVGSGKTIVSISYAIRKYSEDPDAKIVMCGPPSLIKMWWETLQKYFKIEPKVLHNTNTKYKPREDWKECPTEKFILTSYLLLGKNGNKGWFKSYRDLLIVDEAHHQISIPFNLFNEIIGLSATTNKKYGLSRGIKYILRTFDLKTDNCTYNLAKNIIAKKLPAVKYHAYDITADQDVLRMCRSMIKHTKNNEQDLSCIPDICKHISHPSIFTLRNSFTAGYILVGRKSFKVEKGNEALYKLEKKQMIKDHPGLGNYHIQKKMIERATFNILEEGSNYPKYVDAYHIINWANAKGEKVLLFDMSVTYLPFLYKYLMALGINSYIFSTHYDVTGRQRQLSKFKEDEKPGVLLSSISMLGEGQNVTEANHVIFFTQCLDHTKYYQAIGRCWRYPQTKEVNVHLLFSGQFDRKIYEHACGAIDIKNLAWIDLLQ